MISHCLTVHSSKPYIIVYYNYWPAWYPSLPPRVIWPGQTQTLNTVTHRLLCLSRCWNYGKELEGCHAAFRNLSGPEPLVGHYWPWSLTHHLGYCSWLGVSHLRTTCNIHFHKLLSQKKKKMLLLTCSVTRFRFMLRMCFLPSFSPIRQLPSCKTAPWWMQAWFLGCKLDSYLFSCVWS